MECRINLLRLKSFSTTVNDTLDELTQDDLAKLVQHGRINATKPVARRKRTNAVARVRKDEKRATPVIKQKAPDPEWLVAQKEKSERNIATTTNDERRRAEMREASKF